MCLWGILPWRHLSREASPAGWPVELLVMVSFRCDKPNARGHGLQPRYRRVTDAVGPADIRHGLASLKAPDCLADGGCCQFRLAAEPNTTCHRPCTTFAGAGKNQAALEFGQPAQHRYHQLAMWRRGIRPLILERP